MIYADVKFVTVIIALTWSSMYRHIIILEHGDSVMSRSIFFLVELYSLKHHARLTMDIPIENN